MVIQDTHIESKTPDLPKSAIVRYVEHCSKIDPKPIWCEVPDDLTKQTSDTSSSQTYSYGMNAYNIGPST